MDSRTAAKSQSTTLDGGPSEEEYTEHCRRLGDTVRHFLDRGLTVGYRIAGHPLGEPSKVFLFPLDCGVSIYDFQVIIQPKLLVILCGAQIRIPPGQRGTVMEYITRINFNIGMGYFALDLSDGELRFKVVQHTTRSLADDAGLIKTLFGIAVDGMNEHFPLIVNVAFGDMDPERAVREHVRSVKARSEAARRQWQNLPD